MIRPRKHINVIAILLIPVYLLVMGNSIRNRHTHVLPNGLVITHSHPFAESKTGFPVRHGHTKNQVLFYQLFTFDFFQHSPEVFIPASDHSFQRDISTGYSNQVTVSYNTPYFLRGPPLTRIPAALS